MLLFAKTDFLFKKKRKFLSKSSFWNTLISVFPVNLQIYRKYFEYLLQIKVFSFFYTACVNGLSRHIVFFAAVLFCNVHNNVSKIPHICLTKRTLIFVQYVLNNYEVIPLPIWINANTANFIFFNRTVRHDSS